MSKKMPRARRSVPVSLALLLAIPPTALAANCTPADLPRPDFTGKATQQFRDCEKREGEFVKGKLVKGSISFGDGQFREGQFDENGYLNGPGKARYGGGILVEGRFVKGSARGPGKVTYADGKVYEGPLEYSRPDGYGTLTYADGTVERGYITRDGTPFGFTVRKLADGTWMAGEYRDGKPFGNFVVSRPDRTGEVVTYAWGGAPVAKGAGGAVAATPPGSSPPSAAAAAAAPAPAASAPVPAAPAPAAALPSVPVANEVNKAVQGLRGLFGK